MKTTEFKQTYYLELSYKQVSEVEFKSTVTVYERSSRNEITRESVKIDFLKIDQQLSDSQYSLTPISWQTYLNQTITMLFNLIMLRFGIVDLYLLNDRNKIIEFFNQNPFLTE